jgi:hypothetical protein
MYISISWPPTNNRNPRIETTTDLAALLRSAYLAGLRGDAVVIDEYCNNESDTPWRLFASASITVGDSCEGKDPSLPNVEQNEHRHGESA